LHSRAFEHWEAAKVAAGATELGNGMNLSLPGDGLQKLQAIGFEWGPKILSALVILLLAHLIAKAVKWGMAAVLDRLPFARTANAGAAKDETLGARIGEIGYWLVWLVGLVATLTTLGLSQVVAPLNRLVAGFFVFLPNVVGAGIIFFIGWVVAMVTRRVVGSTVAAFRLGDLTSKLGMPNLTSQSVAVAAGQISFVLIIVPVAIAGLQALKINAISDPAVAVLTQLLDTIPRLIAASIVLGFAFFISRWIAGLIEQTLPTMGFDASVKQLGLFSESTEGEFPATKAVAWIATTAVMIFAAIEAAKLLQFDSASLILNQILALGGKILFGGIIIAAGVALANLIANALTNAGGATAGFASNVARWATIALSTAMGLNFMGIADSIIQTAFTLILGAAAIAIAIAFGWGGRETAAKLLARWIK
jgi:Conserved TM helix